MAVTIEEKIPGVNEKPRWRVATDKGSQVWTIRPTFDGFVFYEIVQDKGTLPDALRGKFTRPKEALDTVLRYEKNMQVSRAKKRDEYQKTREERKAS